MSLKHVGLQRKIAGIPRLPRHLLIGAVSFALCMLISFTLQDRRLVFLISMSTAYTSLILFTVTLSIGPWRVLRNKVNPLSNDLRRDIGIWSGVLALIHVVAGLQVHFVGRIWMYFVKPGPAPLNYMPQLNLFGLANYGGLVITAIFIMLLALSNNWSLRRLGASKWKSLQRWTYWCAGILIFHGAAYQITETRDLPHVALFVLIVLAGLTAQVAGRVFRRAHSHNRDSVVR